jgi:hypothetical protein
MVIFRLVLWRMSGPKRDEVTGGWRKLHNEELDGMKLHICIVSILLTHSLSS